MEWRDSQELGLSGQRWSGSIYFLIVTAPISQNIFFPFQQTEHKEAVLTRDFELQEKTYRASYEALVNTYQNFNKDIQELYRVSE